MSTHALFLVRMDVAHDHEATFNEVYDKEHVPNLRSVPGVQRASRYRQPSPTDSRYIAAYELDSLAVLDTPAWKSAGEAGRWPGEIRPHTMNRHLTRYEWIGGALQRALRPRAPAAAAQAAGLGQRRALPHHRPRRAPLSLRLRGREHDPAHVPDLERHLRHRPLEARGAALHAQQALHRQRADVDAVSRDRLRRYFAT
jgi:hypothetical protein